jgi:molybdenum cofactor guanylyltransferase
MKTYDRFSESAGLTARVDKSTGQGRRHIKTKDPQFVLSIIPGKWLTQCDNWAMPVAGFVLVGGGSSRMGRDKARLALESRFLVEDVAAKVAYAAGRVALVGAAERYRDLNMECLSDLRPSLGPLAGIEAALAAQWGTLNLIVACDMPNLRVEWFRRLIARAEEHGSVCVVCQDASQAIHPLCSVWSERCLPPVRKALDERRLRVLDLIRELQAEFVTIDDHIRNINTPAEWENWRNSVSRKTVHFS